ncbi:septum formation initiator family protein [Patescibacteria group bacterium]|nr:septum formation initiator family protein [Candidatus Falkowbacteria bacterium]MBU3905504.1 septum formation initiator family protein [Patescibacteria group bacterium]MCG2698579.1 septum formation initiator family protein [Candidatus Parcubacteria bacterium]MBU4014708.1 septum formation initiator family protein [Patescibacteria group bacterium]MBU4026611.1 septum formation initiator family protein [Patescibacteria group bacterium]
MLNRNNKNSGGKILFNQKILALAGVVVIILISVPLAKNISQRYRIDQEIKEMEREIAELESKNNGLSEAIRYLESNQFIEEQARLRLGLKKQGEEVAVIKENKEAGLLMNEAGGSGDIGDLNNSNELNSNPRKWRRYFFE